MASASRLVEDDLLCPVCCDVFADPVLLSCSHSVCRACLLLFWEAKESPECPVCRRKSSKPEPPLNLALKRLCESFGEGRGRGGSSEASGAVCELHNEKLKLFCLDDQQPVCVVCQSSKRHKNHQFCPLDEVLSDIKKELWTALEPLLKSQTELETAEENYSIAASHVKSQVQNTECQMRKEFEMLHQFLRDEEEARIAALRQEDEQKSLAMKTRMDETSREKARLQGVVREAVEGMDVEDVAFLQSIKSTVKQAQRTAKPPENETNLLINVSEHISNLKFRVWERMHAILQYTSVTLDPNSAHSQLRVSDNLTAVEHRKQEAVLPDNPERFDSVMCVVGCKGFNSGSHCWDVEVGDGIWELGVIKASARRKKNSFCDAVYSVSYSKGSYHTICPGQAGNTFRAKDKPQKVRVHLDWNKGNVKFSDLLTNTDIHTITHTFTETVFPFFYSSCRSRPLKILPVKQTVSVLTSL